jgi:signal transduction histidine kinase
VALAVVLGLAMVQLLARGMTSPLREMAAAAGAMARGDHARRVRATSRDEVGDLARALAAMTGQLRASREQLVQAEKLASIGEMSAAVAHGLRNPLASLRAAAQFVRHHPASPGATEHLDAIIEEVDRLDRRISHLLSFSRPAPFHPGSESLPRLIDDLLPAVATPIREQHVELEMAVPVTLPAVRVDPMQLEQAILEIVSNALDAMPGGGRLRIGAYVANGEGPAAVVLEVSDTGGGIPEQALSSVCEPFFTTRQEGTGLGLAIAKRYIEQNGGRLEIASRVGEGTTVRVRLPAERTA